MAPTAIRDSEPHSSDIRNVVTRRRRKSSIGRGVRRACHQYSIAEVAPTPSSAATIAVEPTPRLATSIPNIRQASAVPDRIRPRRSNLVRTGSFISSMKIVTRAMPARPIGTLM